MFFAFNRLINEKETLIIDDDDTFDEKKKYLEIKREENNIKIIFHNNISNIIGHFFNNPGLAPTSQIQYLGFRSIKSFPII